MIAPALAVELWDASTVARKHGALAAFEATFTYPLGHDRFRIDHGNDYLAFFRGLGEPRAFVALRGRAVVGVLVAVRRQLPEPVWYLCDFKAARDAPGAGRALFARFEDEARGGTARCYGVSMDPRVGPNRFREAALRRRGAGVVAGPRLAVWSLDEAAWCAVEPAVRRTLGPLAWYDPTGTKDLVLASTGAPMRLLHVQHGPLARPGAAGPRPGFIHMMCLPEHHPLVPAMPDPGAWGSILHRAMDDADWSVLLTSDI